MRISIEVSPPGNEPDTNGLTDGVFVEIYLDSAGRDKLVNELQAMNWNRGIYSNEHFHLDSPKWGGRGLTEERRDPNSHICRGLKVYLRPEGEALWNSDKQ